MVKYPLTQNFNALQIPEAISKLFGVIGTIQHLIFFPLFASAKSGAKSSPRTPTLNWLFTQAALQSRQLTVRAVRGRPTRRSLLTVKS
jgi:hypothetical protein